MNNAYIRAQQCKVKEAKFPFVKIGTQYWTTKNLSLAVTPQGNTIPEMQANGNVEKATNTGINGTTDWVDSNTDGLADGLNAYTGINSIIVTGNGFTGNAQRIEKGTRLRAEINSPLGIVIGKYYRVTGKYRSGGTFYFSNPDNGIVYYSLPLNEGNAIAFTVYIAPTCASYFYLKSNLWFEIDELSVQEVGWSDSQNLYDGIYAQTSGTVEQKTYAAVKAAAMWCNYNNDAPTGLIYGKLYNWFAVKLLQMDIDYYNTANPTKPYIWRVPTQSEFQTLSTYLGGDAVSGGHLKEAGLDHWASPNTGADNSSGFSALGSGIRNLVGTFVGLKDLFRSWAISEMGVYGGKLGVSASSSACTIDLNIASKPFGYGIRLIKS